MRSCRVVAVDVGSVSAGNFAWAALDLPAASQEGLGGAIPLNAAEAVSGGLQRHGKVALGFESPIMVPVPCAGAEGWTQLGKGRAGEGNRSWSAGAGTGALATGLVQMAWVLQEVAARLPAVTVTTQPRHWLEERSALLVWEAFVSGPGKPVRLDVSQHAADAAAAVETFAARWTNGMLTESNVTCAPGGSFNLAAASAIYAGLDIESDEISLPVSVYRTQPAA